MLKCVYITLQSSPTKKQAILIHVAELHIYNATMKLTRTPTTELTSIQLLRSAHNYTDKKKPKFALNIRKFRRDRLQTHTGRPPHIQLNICAFPRILEKPSSRMTLQPIPSEYLIYKENCIFFFIANSSTFCCTHFDK